MTELITAFLAGVPAKIKVLLLAAIPVTELRVAIPMGLALGVSPLENYFYAVVGNMLPVVPIFLFLRPFIALCSRIPALDRLLQRIFARTRRHSDRLEKYGAIGLAIFVGVPAPGTGAWTGSLLAFLFGIRFIYAFPAIMLGVSMAGLIVTIASMGIWYLARLGVPLLLAALSIAIACYLILKSRR